MTRWYVLTQYDALRTILHTKNANLACMLTQHEVIADKQRAQIPTLHHFTQYALVLSINDRKEYYEVNIQV